MALRRYLGRAVIVLLAEHSTRARAWRRPDRRGGIWCDSAARGSSADVYPDSRRDAIWADDQVLAQVRRTPWSDARGKRGNEMTTAPDWEPLPISSIIDFYA